MAKKQILLINDLAGYGKVATAAMLPILSYMGYPVYNMPTALVSNTLDYGKFNIMETTDYMQGVFPVWKELGFSFDAIATGFICSERQARMVADYCKEQALRGTIIFVDPIMGDEGKLYNGVTPERVDCMREMVAVADLIFPNYTEAAYLTAISNCPMRKFRSISPVRVICSQPFSSAICFRENPCERAPVRPWMPFIGLSMPIRKMRTRTAVSPWSSG